MIHAEAVAYMAKGWSVFPVQGKVPCTTKGLLDADRNPRSAAIWFERHPTRGIGLATGRTSGVWVLDVDGEEAARTLRSLADSMGGLPETVLARTGREDGGYHLYWKMPEGSDIRNSAGKIGPGLDVRGSGGYVVLPPSPHPDGRTYNWVKGRGPDDIEIIEAPEWLVRLVVEPTNGNGKHADPLPDRIGQGQRDVTLTSLAGSLRRRGASYESILAAIEAENQIRCDPPMGVPELRRIAGSVARYAPAAVATTNGNGNTVTPPTVLEIVDADVLARIGADKQLPLSVVPTPWESWNRICRGAGGGCGLAHGWHVVIGASSGSGKSMVAVNMISTAIRSGEHVALLSLEMSRAEVLTRLLAIYANEPVTRLEHGLQFDPARWESASEEFGQAAGSLHLNDEPLLDLDDIVQAATAAIERGERMIVVDYLQLAWVKRADSMVQQITEVSHAIRALARRYKVLTVGLSQMHRQQTFNGGEVRKEGLLGGSSLENDADQVLLLSPPKPDAHGNYQMEFKLDKNRHGPAAKWDMMLSTQNLRMRELMPDETG